MFDPSKNPEIIEEDDFKVEQAISFIGSHTSEADRQKLFSSLTKFSARPNDGHGPAIWD